jgi:hypothetical protein
LPTPMIATRTLSCWWREEPFVELVVVLTEVCPFSEVLSGAGARRHR